MSLTEFLDHLNTVPETVSFDNTMAVIEANYAFTETAFKNGDVYNSAGQNNGSCKIFAFGLLNKLTAEQTLHCFGDYYRKDVLDHPGGGDHQNIRNFIRHGCQGVHFEGEALFLR